jgi:hypothetical protein
MALRRNRYDSRNLLSQLARQRAAKDGDDWCFSFRYATYDQDDFVVVLPNEEREHEDARHLLESFFSHIQELDNLIQKTLDAECMASGIEQMNYAVYIGHMKIMDRQVAVQYWGSETCATYKAVFQQTEVGSWIRADPVAPMYSRKLWRP